MHTGACIACSSQGHSTGAEERGGLGEVERIGDADDIILVHNHLQHTIYFIMRCSQ